MANTVRVGGEANFTIYFLFILLSLSILPNGNIPILLHLPLFRLYYSIYRNVICSIYLHGGILLTNPHIYLLYAAWMEFSLERVLDRER